jgi:glutamate decarboxylase
MIARLFNAPLEDGQTAVGAGTVGSSEAIMLAGLAFKRKWQLERKAAGLPYDKPNMVTGANVQVLLLSSTFYFFTSYSFPHLTPFHMHIDFSLPSTFSAHVADELCCWKMQVCWEKFANYFEVEIRAVKLHEGYYVMDPAKAVELCDENTICICAILGSTYNGEFEDVGALNDLLLKKNKEKGSVAKTTHGP